MMSVYTTQPSKTLDKPNYIDNTLHLDQLMVYFHKSSGRVS